MKIIALMDSNTRLVEITAEEIAILQGYTTRYDAGFNEDTLRVGHIIDIKKFLKISTNVKNLNTLLLKDILTKLAGATDSVSDAIKTANEINCFEKLKDGP